MKKAIIALTILGFTYISADAQTKTTTTTTVSSETAKAVDTPNYAKNYKVCKGSSTYYVCGDKPSGKKKSVATTKTTKVRTSPAVANRGSAVPSAQGANAKNYKVCKGNGNYHICDQPQNATNTVPGPNTELAVGASDPKPITKTTTVTENGVIATTSTQTFSQPPVAAPALADQSDNTLPGATITGHVDTITNANAPYHGKNSPQYDGAQKNKARNLNTPPGAPNSIPITNK